MTTTKITPAPLARSLGAIAEEIATDWPKVRETGTESGFGRIGQHPANPYWQAMGGLRNLDGHYGQDTADSIVRYFLANAQGWRGPVAQRVKVELKAALAHHEQASAPGLVFDPRSGRVVPAASLAGRKARRAAETLSGRP